MNGKLTGITKKITIAFLAMVMTVAFMPVMAFADDGDETAYECRQVAVVVEVDLGPLHLLLRQLQQMPHLAVGKSIDDGSAKPTAKEIVDIGTQ